MTRPQLRPHQSSDDIPWKNEILQQLRYVEARLQKGNIPRFHRCRIFFPSTVWILFIPQQVTCRVWRCVKEGSDKGSDSDRDDGGFSHYISPKDHWVGDVFWVTWKQNRPRPYEIVVDTSCSELFFWNFDILQLDDVLISWPEHTLEHLHLVDPASLRAAASEAAVAKPFKEAGEIVPWVEVGGEMGKTETEGLFKISWCCWHGNGVWMSMMNVDLCPSNSEGVKSLRTWQTGSRWWVGCVQGLEEGCPTI